MLQHLSAVAKWLRGIVRAIAKGKDKPAGTVTAGDGGVAAGRDAIGNTITNTVAPKARASSKLKG